MCAEGNVKKSLACDAPNGNAEHARLVKKEARQVALRLFAAPAISAFPVFREVPLLARPRVSGNCR